MKGNENALRVFFEKFVRELGEQVELGHSASDSDYLAFQRSVNANVKDGAKIRHQILLRKLLRMAPSLADLFDPSIVAESGIAGRIFSLAASIRELIQLANDRYSATHGEDLFKATNKTTAALARIGRPARDHDGYGELIDDLYFLVHESVGPRLDPNRPQSFVDVNALRTDLRHDLDHGKAGRIRGKRRKIGQVFQRYSGIGTPGTLAPERFPLFQANLLGAIEGDLQGLPT